MYKATKEQTKIAGMRMSKAFSSGAQLEGAFLSHTQLERNLPKF
jgi:hypothetical protein